VQSCAKDYFPVQWKVAQVVLILKPGKHPNELASYRPINLLPIVSKVCEKTALKEAPENGWKNCSERGPWKWLKIADLHIIISASEWERDTTVEQTHRIVQRINEALENKQYCSAAFLDISQAFDKVWHTGLLFKLRRFLPLSYFILVKSYLHSRRFLVKFASEYTELSLV
jgi:hypothetical protein